MVGLLMLLAGAQFSSNMAQDVMTLGGDKALLLAPPMVIADYTSDRPVWSPEGKYVLCTRLDLSMKDLVKAVETKTPPEAGWSILVWSLASKKTTEVYSYRGTIDRMPNLRTVGWIRGTDTAYAVVQISSMKVDEAPVNQLVKITPTGKAQITPLQTDAYEFKFQPSPRSPFGVLVMVSGSIAPKVGAPTPASRWELSTQFLGASGQLGHPTATQAMTSELFWSEDGKTAFLQKEPVSQGAQAFASIDAQGNERPTSTRPMMALQFERLVDLQLVAMQAKGGTEGNSSPLDMLWLKSSEKSEKPQALISAEAPESLAMLSPTENAVVYVTRGVAMVRTFVPVPKEMFIQAATSADKTKAISDAKQAALAAIMFASDNDDEMPKPGDTEKLYPYLKNREILNRFVYTYQGGNLGELKDPAGTEIGYVEGPGGRAIAYADGHVKWKNN